MQTDNLNIVNKGAATIVNHEVITQFTYIAANGPGECMHLYYSEYKDTWIHSRDNGIAMNADNTVMQKINKKFNNPLE